MGPAVIVLDLPDVAEIAGYYLADLRRPPPGRPWVTLGMVSSLDGAAAVDGRSSGIGGPPDKAVFRALRAVCDVVLVGANTVRTERYRAVDLPEQLLEWRRSRGMDDNPRVAIVSRSLDLDLSESLAASRPIILTAAASPSEEVARLREVAEVVVAGEDSVDLGDALGALRRMGVERVTLEGGPTLNGQLVAAGLVDEACVTIAPVVVGGAAPRIVAGPLTVNGLTATRLIHSHGHLLLRYLFD
jgi:riboflavin-specific deaminase-like protein